MSERVSDEDLHDYMVTDPRSKFERLHNLAFAELIAHRKALERAQIAIETGAKFIEFVCDNAQPESSNQQHVIAMDRKHAATLRSLLSTTESKK